MKRAITLFSAVFLLTCLLQQANAQTAAANNKNVSRQFAKEGDSVWLIINHVKADRRQQFERFVNEVFWPMAKKLSAEDQRLFRQTRVLHPTQAEADGTYSYVFIMDPLIKGGDYEIDRLLRKMYTEDKAVEYGKLFGESMARDQTQMVLVQSRY